jgi:mono/diheme cytochrome c family protein
MVRAFALLILLIVVAGAFLTYPILKRGLSTRVEPSALEALIARGVRRLATPRAMKDARNPVEPTGTVLEDGLAHFADHCASCHANDGSGQTDLGRSFYPPAPDMREAPTQSLSDGELFSIIENGIRLTGMPAWGTGTPEGELGSWALVHFIRRLPSLSAEDIARMEGLNPRSPEQFREEEEIKRFLAGEEQPSPPDPPSAHKHRP